jgi:gluconokinase
LLGAPEKIIVSGGITRSPLWMQLAADVFGFRLETTGSQNDSTVGAALVMLSSLNKDGRIITPICKDPVVFEPSDVSRAALLERYAHYKELYERTAPKGVVQPV